MTPEQRNELEQFSYATPRPVNVSWRRPEVTRSRRLLVAFVSLMTVGLLIAPWRQSSRGNGRVVAYSPTDRIQSIEAPIKGRIVKWYVQEGSKVKVGDPILDLADNDPDYASRLERSRQSAAQRVVAAKTGLSMSNMTLLSLEGARTAAVSHAELYVQVTRDKLDLSKQEVDAAEAALLAADQNYKRQKKLAAEGLTSSRNVELGLMKRNTGRSKLQAAKAKRRVARSEVSAARAKLNNITSKETAAINKAQESIAKQQAVVAKAEGDLAKAEVDVSRQRSMKIVAQVDGTVLRLTANSTGIFVKPGQQIAQIVPDTQARAVEVWVAGNDMPLITTGREVRIQFEGWPAVQFVGWPSTAVGTFGGIVAFVDATDDGKGKFRVVVTPDPSDDPWPQERFLRQGVRANGWILLDQVSVGFELWRQFNGFPAAMSSAPPGSTNPQSGDKKGDKAK